MAITAPSKSKNTQPKTSAKDMRTTIGLPQGGILSPLMWTIMIADLKQRLQELGEEIDDVFIEAFADDITICHWGETPEEIETKHKDTMDRIQYYFQELHLHLSKDKSKCVWCPTRNTPSTFLRSVPTQTKYSRSENGGVCPTLFHPLPDTPNILPPKVNIPIKKSIRILGVIFDHKFTFQEHIVELMAKLKIRSHILRKLSNTSWGSSIDLLSITYKSIIQNTLSHGISAWGGHAPEERF